MTSNSQTWRSVLFTRFFGEDVRDRQVRVATIIGGLTGLGFAIFNLLSGTRSALGMIELGTVLFLIVPTIFMSRYSHLASYCETMLMLACMVIMSALVVLGGNEGTGLFWINATPFLAFFLKGQRGGWRYSLALMALTFVYLYWFAPLLPFAYQRTPVVTQRFLLSLGFYTLLAATFNYVRNQNVEQIRQARDAADAALLQLKQANQKTEAAYAAKSRFLAAASHDLRQPAHALGLFVAQMNPASTKPELIAGLDASVRAMQEMLDVFFDYSRLDAGSVSLQLQPVAVEGLFEQLRICFVNLAEQKGLRLRMRPSKAWLQSDPVLLQRVLLNLVSNAIRYTERGGILVTCRIRQNQACIQIRDTGIGISPEHQDKIFEEFYQVRNQARDRTQGLGLGLSMVQRSCELLQHPLTLHSQPNRGSCFTLTVPLAPAPRPVPPPVAEAAAPLRATSHLSVLLIEDDVLSSAATLGLLESWGYSVYAAHDGASALALCPGQVVPDFVVCDYRLPGSANGIELIAQLRQACGREVPACLVSGDIGEQLRQRATSARLELLPKPVQASRLRSVMQNTIRIKPASGLA